MDLFYSAKMAAKSKSLEFDEEGFRQVVSDIANFAVKLPDAMQKCLAYFPALIAASTVTRG